MTYQDLKIGDIVHMTYHNGDDIYTLYSHIIDIQNHTITFDDLYCDKGPTFRFFDYQITFTESTFTLISVVEHHLPIDQYFKSLFPELSL